MIIVSIVSQERKKRPFLVRGGVAHCWSDHRESQDIRTFTEEVGSPGTCLQLWQNWKRRTNQYSATTALYGLWLLEAPLEATLPKDNILRFVKSCCQPPALQTLSSPQPFSPVHYKVDTVDTKMVTVTSLPSNPCLAYLFITYFSDQLGCRFLRSKGGFYSPQRGEGQHGKTMNQFSVYICPF